MSEKKIPLTPSEVKAALTKLMQDATILSVAMAIKDIVVSGDWTKVPEGFKHITILSKEIADTFDYGDEFREAIEKTISDFCDAASKALDGDPTDYLRMVREHGNVSPESMTRMEQMAAEAVKRRHGVEGTA